LAASRLTVTSGAEVLPEADGFFCSCLDYATIVRHARMVFDVRNATRNVVDGREKVVRL